MFIHFARFITPPPKDQVRRLFEQRRGRYREVLVLLQKTYINKTSTGVFRGCFIFVSEESPRALRQAELARTTRADYQVVDIRVEGYEVFIPLL